jgi:hypothetical protein
MRRPGAPGPPVAGTAIGPDECDPEMVRTGAVSQPARSGAGSRGPPGMADARRCDAHLSERIDR